MRLKSPSWKRKETHTKTLSNENARSVEQFDYDAAVEMLDDEIREDVAADLAPCTEQEFFAEYAKRHAEKYGEEWELDKSNPVW